MFCSISVNNNLFVIFSYKMTKDDGSIVCEASSSHCFVDGNGRPIKVAKVNPELDAAITSNIGIHID